MDNISHFVLNEISTWGPKVASVVMILIAFYILSKVLRNIITKTTSRLRFDIHLSSLFVKTINIILTIFAIVTALGTLGINVSALVAGLGLTGFALGFALKDTISNLLSGVLILLYQPFKVGNTIKVSGFEGKVVCIDLRYTELRFENNKVLIPNSKLFTDPIVVIDLD